MSRGLLKLDIDPVILNNDVHVLIYVDPFKGDGNRRHGEKFVPFGFFEVWFIVNFETR